LSGQMIRADWALSSLAPRAHGMYVSRSQPVDFMVDTDTKHFVVTLRMATISKRHQTIVGATGTQTSCSFLQPWKCTLRMHLVSHEFLYVPECPVALMGRDMLSKLWAQINFQKDGQEAWALAQGPLGS
jgi:hypothetical protein